MGKAIQLTFDLPAMDSEQTRRRVEEHLETVRIYRQIGFVRREVSNTPNYEPREFQGTNSISKPAENAAVWNADKEAELEQKSIMLDMALHRLSKKERELITRRYLEEDEIFDYTVCADMNMSERTFGRVKARAIYKIAFALRLEVLVEVEKPFLKKVADN